MRRDRRCAGARPAGARSDRAAVALRSAAAGAAATGRAQRQGVDGISSITYGYGRRSVVAQFSSTGSRPALGGQGMSTLNRTLRAAAVGALVALAGRRAGRRRHRQALRRLDHPELDPGTAKALKGLGVSVTPSRRPRPAAKGLSFPITGGTSIPPPRRARSRTAAACSCAPARRRSGSRASRSASTARRPSRSRPARRGCTLLARAGRRQDQPRRAGHQRLRRRRQAERQGRGRAQRGLRREGLQARPARRHRHGEGGPCAGRLQRRSHLARARPRHRSGADLAGLRGRPGRAGDRQPGRQPRLPDHRRQGRRQDAGRQHHP